MLDFKNKKNERRFKQLVLLHLLDKKKSHLGTSYDVAHLAELTPVVQKMDLTHPLNKSLSSG